MALLFAFVLVVGGLPVATRAIGETEVAAAQAMAVAPGFQDTTAWSGLTRPTSIRFADDGRVFVAEKSGTLKVFDSLADTSPTTFTGLQTNVHDYWDRGLMGLALDPSLTGGVGTGAYVYVLYSYDHILGDVSSAPRWGDQCPTPPGPVNNGCVISGRLSRLAVSGSSISGPEQVLLEGWCQQFPGHTVDGLAFGPDEKLYVSAGEGASFGVPDYGQLGGTTTPVVTPKNPCGDPPGGVGGTMTAPTAQGGSLRSQDIRGGTDPVGLSGAILRVDPATGAGAAGNPFAGSADANARRIIAYGFRNPFRFTLRPGTKELWVGDVGWETWEELDVLADSTDAIAENFGWPCYEGAARQPSWDALNLSLCETLYSQGAAGITAPYFKYSRSQHVATNEACPTGGSSLSGLAFYPATGGSYPEGYAGGLFVADYSRKCIWFMPKGANGRPDPVTTQVFATGVGAIDLVIGPGGDLFYPDYDSGTIHRVIPTGGNVPPNAVMSYSSLAGPAPVTAQFSSAGSFDAEGTPLSFAWDLDGDGQFDDATTATAEWTYEEPASLTIGLRVTDGDSFSSTVTKTVAVANDPPVPLITGPSPTTKWKVGDTISFGGSATDLQDGALPAPALSWSLVLQHCPSLCHPHTIQSWTGVASGSFTAPDHEYPSYLELTLTATDALGTSTSVTRRLDPRTVMLTFKSSPAPMKFVFNGAALLTNVTRTVIVGSANAISAVTPQAFNGATWKFSKWSDGGGASHIVIAPATDATYLATYWTSSKFFAPIADAQVRLASPTRNYGHGTVLRVRAAKSRVYLKFSVTGLSAPSPSTKLRIWVADPGPAGGSIYRVSNSWTETGITWNNRPSISGSPRSTVGAVTTGQWVEFNLGAVITGNGTYSFAIAGGSDNWVDYASRETSHSPYLVVSR